MISLRNQRPIGQGCNRACYEHPDDPTLCLKVNFDDRHRSETADEIEYYQRLSRMRPDFDFQSIPRCYGWVETDLGPAGAYEMIRDDATGKPSRLLRVYLQGLTSYDSPRLCEALRRFSENLISFAVPVRDLSPDNLCVQRLPDGDYRVVAVDCLGHRDFIPLVDYWRSFALKKVRRHVRRHRYDQPEQLVA